MSLYGFSYDYVKVGTLYDADLVNTIQQVELKEISKTGFVKAEVVSEIVV